MAGARRGQSTRAGIAVVPALAGCGRGDVLRGLGPVRAHPVPHRHRHLSDGRPGVAGQPAPLPRGRVVPHTPLAAIVFCPFSWLHMPAAGVAITLLTLVLLIVSTVIVLTGLDVWNASAVLPGPAWLRRLWLAVIIAAAATTWL